MVEFFSPNSGLTKLLFVGQIKQIYMIWAWGKKIDFRTCLEIFFLPAQFLAQIKLQFACTYKRERREKRIKNQRKRAIMQTKNDICRRRKPDEFCKRTTYDSCSELTMTLLLEYISKMKFSSGKSMESILETRFYLRRYDEKSRDYLSCCLLCLLMLLRRFSNILNFWKIFKLNKPQILTFWV